MIANIIGFGFISGGSTPPVVPTAADFYHDTITVADGNANAFVYAPEGYDNAIPDGGWPLIICFHTALAQFDVASTSGNPYLTIMEIYLHP